MLAGSMLTRTSLSRNAAKPEDVAASAIANEIKIAFISPLLGVNMDEAEALLIAGYASQLAQSRPCHGTNVPAMSNVLTLAYDLRHNPFCELQNVNLHLQRNAYCEMERRTDE
jgi:hypothetical protein